MILMIFVANLLFELIIFMTAETKYHRISHFTPKIINVIIFKSKIFYRNIKIYYLKCQNVCPKTTVKIVNFIIKK